jgi:hypothetical protein
MVTVTDQIKNENGLFSLPAPSKIETVPSFLPTN